MAEISILSDNRASGPDFGSEWGLSMCIDLEEQGLWLWDTGASDLFLGNAKRLGVDPGKALGVMLSHGHYDHTGGLAALTRETGFSGPVFGHPDILLKRYSSARGNLREIGYPDPPAEGLTDFRPVRGVLQVAPGLTMVTPIARRPGFFQAVEHFSLDQEGRRPDSVPDDACLVLETGPARVLILGCCHSGLGNTMSHLRDELGFESFSHVIGGLHLFQCQKPALDEAVSFLREFGVESVRPCHCTGEKAAEFLAQALPGRVRPLGAGEVITFRD